MNSFDIMNRAQTLRDEHNRRIAAMLAIGFRRVAQRIKHFVSDALAAVSKETGHQLQARRIRS